MNSMHRQMGTSISKSTNATTIVVASLWIALTMAVYAQPPRRAHATASFSVKVTGKGIPMILIPGMTCGGDVWDSTVAHFKDRYECHVFTLAGFAGQPAIPAPMLETIRNDLAAYIQAKKLVKPVIVGHSLGGFLAWWLASTNPDLVGPVISVDGGTFFSALMDPTATVEKAKAQAEMMQKSMESMEPAAFAAQNKMMLATMVTEQTNVDVIAATSGKSDPKATGLAAYEMITTDLREDVARIKTATLLIGAAAFAKTPEMKQQTQERYEGQVAKIPNHKVVLAERARHFIMYDDPQFLFAQMEGFLRKQ
jgi:N-formylmaleamate deformylase